MTSTLTLRAAAVWLLPWTMLVIVPLCLADEPLRSHFDLSYQKVSDTELKLDLLQPPADEADHPVVIVIHGGAWRSGDKASNRPVLERLARRGYVAVSPSYRFCPANPFPAQVHDVKAAIRWVRVHADEYDIDPARVAAMGFSAGGHLALMLGMTGPADGLEGSDVAGDAPDTKVQAVVNFFGPTDLNAPDIPAVSRQLVHDFLGAFPEDNRDLAAKASPRTYATADDPPVLTFQGTKDPLVPHTQATILADALTEVGVPGRVELLIGAGHGWKEPDLSDTFEETLDFLDRYLKSKPTAGN